MSKPSIHPVKWTPPASPGTPAVHTLPELTVVPVPGEGPEDVLWDGDHLITGLVDGRIVRTNLDGWRLEVIGDTGGRPLGIEHYVDGRILICDATKGLLLLDRDTGEIETLIAAGQHDLRVCNNAAVAADGTVYFSDSSQRFDLEYWTADLLEHSGTGRLLRRSPDGAVDVLAVGLQFANGVALTDEFAVVAQTGEYGLNRVWLDDGRMEPWITNLPAFPDNLSTDEDGLIWVAMASARKAALDGLPAKVPFLRKVVWGLPEMLHPKPDTLTWVRAYDVHGDLVHEFFGEHEQFFMATGVRAAGGRVAMGSLNTTAIAWFETSS